MTAGAAATVVAGVPTRPRRLQRPDGELTVDELSFRAMNCAVHVVVVAPSAESARRALLTARRMVEDREQRWSRFLPDSEIAVLNRNTGRPVIVGDDTFSLVARAIGAATATDGVFDPTIGSTLVAAGYDRSFELLGTRGRVNEEQPPSSLDGSRSEAGRAATDVPAPGIAGIELHSTSKAIVLPAGTMIDLGGIAKGATADAVVERLLPPADLTDRRGGDEGDGGGGASHTGDGAAIVGCCVNIGGDLRAAGVSPDDRGWTITLDCPGSDATRAIAVAAGGVCTSTITRRRWRTPSGEEHHLRDPRTGRSLSSGVVSASVIGARAEQAEVLAKLAIAVGHQRAIDELVTREATGLLVLDGGSIVELPGFDGFALP